MSVKLIQEADEMNRKVADWLCVLLIVVTLLVTFLLYPGLPDPMPSHWNAAGQVDSHLSKPWGVAILPLSAIFMFALMRVIPLIAPKSYQIAGVSRVLALMQFMVVAFVCAIAVLVLFEAKGFDTRFDKVIFAGVGLIFVVVGNAFRDVPPNYLFGIRTPWTLASDTVWRKTHRLGSWTFTLAGLLLMVNAFLRHNLAWTIIAIFVLLLFPVFYSFFIRRQSDVSRSQFGQGR
jgi:uncharacterized membrane protein